MKNIFLSDRFFWGLTLIAGLFLLSFSLTALYFPAIVILVLFALLTLADYFLLFGKSIRLRCRRIMSKVLSLGDANTISIEIQNLSSLHLQATIIDEIPIELQEREFILHSELKAGDRQRIKYQIEPKSRGSYGFGDIRLFISSQLGLLERRLTFDRKTEVPVYPSIIQMKQYSLRAFDRSSMNDGLKKMRRIGHSYEFENIKSYVRGDDPRSINWKASSRRGHIMVNQYEEERAQNIYCIIDKSRSMRMPFEGLSLMDYAINTSLAISNVVLQKHDRAGLLTFSDKIGATIKADSRSNQLNKILTALYREKERPLEANFELLYQSTRRLVKGRSLLLLFTNFESVSALDRVLPILRRINKTHLLVVIFFKNTEITDFVKMDVDSTEAIYHNTIARKFIADKKSMVIKLKQFGIQAVLTRPEKLSINTINKYLELKARGLI